MTRPIRPITIIPAMITLICPDYRRTWSGTRDQKSVPARISAATTHIHEIPKPALTGPIVGAAPGRTTLVRIWRSLYPERRTHLNPGILDSSHSVDGIQQDRENRADKDDEHDGDDPDLEPCQCEGHPCKGQHRPGGSRWSHQKNRSAGKPTMPIPTGMATAAARVKPRITRSILIRGVIHQASHYENI